MRREGHTVPEVGRWIPGIGYTIIGAIAWMKPECSHFESLDKSQLREMADWLQSNEPKAVERCICFIEADSKGLWHNRARAMMARRLKHVRLSSSQVERLLDVILRRFARGCFYEQFKDQLRLANFLDAKRVQKTAATLQSSAMEHVRRYALWVNGLGRSDGAD